MKKAQLQLAIAATIIILIAAGIVLASNVTESNISVTGFDVASQVTPTIGEPVLIEIPRDEINVTDEPIVNDTEPSNETLIPIIEPTTNQTTNDTGLPEENTVNETNQTSTLPELNDTIPPDKNDTHLNDTLVPDLNETDVNQTAINDTFNNDTHQNQTAPKNDTKPTEPGNETIPEQPNQTDTSIVVPTESVELVINVSYPQKIVRSGTAALRATVTNIGDKTAQNVEPVWHLPPGFSQISQHHSCSSLSKGEHCETEIVVETGLSTTTGKKRVRVVANYE